MPRSLWISLTASVVVLAGGFFLVPDLTARQVTLRLLWPLTRLMLFIAMGLLIGQVI